MPQEPKKRHSRQRQGKRRAAIKLVVPKTIVCPNCKALTLPHTICRNCGFYRGKEFLVLKKDKKKPKEKENEKSS